MNARTPDSRSFAAAFFAVGRSENIPKTAGPLPLIIAPSAPESSMDDFTAAARSRTGRTADSKIFDIPAAILSSVMKSLEVKLSTFALRDPKSYISSSLRYAHGVETPSPSQAIRIKHSGSLGQSEKRSPIPRATLIPRFMQNGTSAPSLEPILQSSSSLSPESKS